VGLLDGTAGGGGEEEESRHGALRGVLVLLGSLLALLLDGLLLDDVHHLSLDGLLLEHKAVLIPDEIRHFGIEITLFHASFK
jgi:hypothetical protein